MMSSSRILSSRPSASCITAKPIARTIKGRGRPAPPFFAAQKQGKLSGLFRQSRRRHNASCLSVPETTQLIAGVLWGYGRFRITRPEAGKPRGLFRQGPPRALWGAGRFHTASPEVGKPRWIFHQSLPGALLYGSLSRKPHSSLPGCCGAMDASALPRQEWNPCHKRKKRRKFPPLF